MDTKISLFHRFQALSQEHPNQRYRGMFDLSRYQGGDNHDLVYSPSSRSTHLVPPLKIKLLQGCHEFKTLDEHAAQLCVDFNFGPLHLPAVRQHLNELADAGLLVAYDALKTAITSPKPLPSPPKISSLGVPTRNRPDGLKRCLESYAECAKLYDRDNLEFFIVDQSDQPQYQRENQEVLGQLKARYGIDCAYFGRTQVEQFALELAKHADVPADVIDFGILNPENMPLTLGISRNFMLLNTIGELTMQVDDDTICRVAPCLDLKQETTVTSQYDPTQFWFLSRDEVDTLGGGFTNEDFFALHEQLLGKSISSFFQDGTSPNIEIGADFLRRMEHNGGQIAFTSVGVGGESGMDGAYYFLVMEEKSRKRLMTSEAAYRFALNYHQVKRSVPNATISSGSLIPGHDHGFDNRQALPPFFPVLRGEDLPWGDLLCLMPEGGFIGYLPWHILHKPTAQRVYSTEHLHRRVSRLRSCDVFRMLVQIYNMSRDRSAVKSINALGQSLEEWGSAPLADFEEMLRHSLIRRTSLTIMKMEAELKKYGAAPNYWAADLQQCLDVLRKAVPEDCYIVGVDLVDVYGLEQARIIQQRLVRRYGQLLQSWTAIREVAKSLSARHRILT